jgi:hypothetical protein
LDVTSKECFEAQLRAQLNLRGVKGLSHNGSPLSAGGNLYQSSGGKSVAFINVLPMQDYQLEKWRQAYHSKEAALKHF